MLQVVSFSEERIIFVYKYKFQSNRRENLKYQNCHFRRDEYSDVVGVLLGKVCAFMFAQE